MDPEHPPEGEEGLPPEEPMLAELGPPIRRDVVLTAVLGGLLGVIAMLPVLAGIPRLLGEFRTQPVVDFAALGMVIGLEPSLALGVAIFVLAGTVVLPLLFVVAGAFLPPRQPRRVRGVTFATLMWTGFVLAFWPGGNWITVVLFLGFSLAAHWIYGLVLGATVERLVGIPEHDV